MKNIRDVFKLFGDKKVQVSTLATEINEVPDTVRRWRIKGAIPPRCWGAVIDAALARGEQISADSLMRLHSRSPRQPGRKRKSAALN